MSEYMGGSEAAKKLGLTHQGLAYLIKRGVIHAQRIGVRTILIHKDEVARVAKLKKSPHHGPIGYPKSLTSGKRLK